MKNNLVLIDSTISYNQIKELENTSDFITFDNESHLMLVHHKIQHQKSDSFIQKNELWKKRRKEFYGNLDIENISIKFLLSFYTELFNNMGFDIDFSKNISRHSPHLDYLVYKISKKSNSEIINHTDWISLSELMKK